MAIKLRPLDFNTLNDFEMLAKWATDDEIRHLFTVDFNKGPTVPVKAEDIRKVKSASKTHKYFMVEADGVIIGDVSVDTDFEYLAGVRENTGWLSICIGEKPYRGRGLGFEIMSQLEAICRDMGLKRLELGVFAYNRRAIAFYEAMGYKRFHTIEKFTWYDGSWHDDYRMEKYL